MSISATSAASPAPTQSPQWNLPTYWETTWENFKSNWTFPPPVDTNILREFRYSKYFNGSTTYLAWAAQNSSRPSFGKFGNERAVVHVGDIIEVDWRKANVQSTGIAEPRTVKMSCAICPTGQDVNGSIFHACLNYTGRISTSYNQTGPIPPNQHLVFQRLHSTLPLTNDAVGLCYFSLSDLDGNDSYDNTYPFAVSAAPRKPRQRFSAAHPGGIDDPSIGEVAPSPSFTSPATSEGGNGKPSVGIIVGVAIAVFVFTCLVVAIIWFVWTRTKRARNVKRVDSPGTEDEVEMQRVQHGGVQRRLDRDDDGEAPPAYHESLKHEIVTDHDQRRMAQ